MHHVVFARIALGLVALFCAAALAFAWLRSRPEPAGALATPSEPTATEVDPAAAFDRHCSRCHDADDQVADLREAPDRGAAVLALVELLAEHGATSSREDLAIVRWLHAQASAADEGAGR